MSQNASFQCPKCNHPLAPKLQEDIRVLGCDQCLGIWAEHIDEKKLLEIKPEVFTIDELRRLRKLFIPLGITESIRYVACPVCKNLMWRKNWGSHSGIMVDTCSDHGTWYDKNEIQKIKEFIKLGGIEYEKLKLTENEVTRLESKLTQTALRLDKKVDSAYRRARIYSMLGL